jgi:hypothetical protein
LIDEASQGMTRTWHMKHYFFLFGMLSVPFACKHGFWGILVPAALGVRLDAKEI